LALFIALFFLFTTKDDQMVLVSFHRM